MGQEGVLHLSLANSKYNVLMRNLYNIALPFMSMIKLKCYLLEHVSHCKPCCAELTLWQVVNFLKSNPQSKANSIWLQIILKVGPEVAFF